MYCPKCGGDVFVNYTCGKWSCACVYCGSSIGNNVEDATEISNAVLDSKEAALLREKYNEVEENKIIGEKRLHEHLECLKEQRAETQAFVDIIRRAREITKNSKPAVLIEISWDEFVSTFPKKKK